jgi:hypothetical protein
LATFGDGPPDGGPPTFRHVAKCLIRGRSNFDLLGRRLLLAGMIIKSGQEPI